MCKMKNHKYHIIQKLIAGKHVLLSQKTEKLFLELYR